MSVLKRLFAKEPETPLDALPDHLQQHVVINHADRIILADCELRSTYDFLLWHARFSSRNGLWKTQFHSLTELQGLRDQYTGNGNGPANDPGNSQGVTAVTGGSAQEQATELLHVAALCGATDIHILERPSHTEIQFRIRQDLLVYKELANAPGVALMIAMYRLALSRDSAYAEALAQDASISGEVLDGTPLVSVRLVRGPCYPAGCQFMSLRLQYEGKPPSPKIPEGVRLRLPKASDTDVIGMLQNLGYDDRQIDDLIAVAAVGSGAMLFTGPTGSGKSTLQHYISMWLHQAFPGKRQVTTEQPVEHSKSWAVQLEILNAPTTEEAGREAREKQRLTLRMDPDRLLVAEVRDAEMALMAISAVQTGHGLMTTLHIDDPFDFAERLRIMDFERLSPQIVCNSSIIRAVVYQRLLKTLCPHCKQPWNSDHNLLPRKILKAFRSWGNTSRVHHKNPEGCPRCHFSGTADVRGVAEVVITDEELMSDLVQYGTAVARRRYRARPEADTPVIRRAINLALEGLVDPVDILELGQPIPFREQFERDLRLGGIERQKAAAEADSLFTGDLPVDLPGDLQ